MPATSRWNFSPIIAGKARSRAAGTDEHCFTWIYDGKFLRDRHTVRAEGKPDALGESIYFWDSAAKQLEYLYIESDGGFSRGPVSIDNEALVFPDTSFVEKGKTMVYRSRWQRSGASAYDVVTEFKSRTLGSPDSRFTWSRPGRQDQAENSDDQSTATHRGHRRPPASSIDGPLRRAAAGHEAYPRSRYDRAIVIDALGGLGEFNPDAPEDAPLSARAPGRCARVRRDRDQFHHQ